MIYTIDDFLDQEDLSFYKRYIINSRLSQNIRDDAAFTAKFWSKYGEKINKHLEKDGLHFDGVYDKVTYTNSKNPVIRHRDCKIHDEQFKVLIYLNYVPKGGTIFFLEKNTQLVINKENRLVIFDMSLEHESQKFEGCTKLAIGFRLKKN